MKDEVEVQRSLRGLASVPVDRRREIASLGGKSVPADKRSFAKSRELAASAGRKGGLAVDAAKRSYSLNRELAALSGRKGGKSVPSEKRGFSRNPQLAADAGRKGGSAPRVRK